MVSPTIERIETSIVDLPTIRPHHLSMAVMKTQAMVIIRLLCSDGIEGIGESTTIGGLSYGPESPESIKLTIDNYIAPIVIGKDASKVQQAMLLIESNIQGNNFAKSGIETALWDAQGKRLNVSVATLLGGTVTHSLPVLWTLASGDTGKDIEEAQHYLSNKRHNTFKIKIGRNDPKVDIKHVTAIKKALGEEVKITVDVNQAWSESIAKNAIDSLQNAGVDLIEQPISKENIDGLSRLSAHFNVPIMPDESICTYTDAFKLAKKRAGDVFALKIAKAGGLRNILKIAGIAEAADILLYGGTMLEGTIGTVASAHVFSVLPSLAWGTELFAPLLLTDDIVTKKLTYKNGTLQLPDAPGLGVELDVDKLEKYKRK